MERRRNRVAVSTFLGALLIAGCGVSGSNGEAERPETTNGPELSSTTRITSTTTKPAPTTTTTSSPPTTTVTPTTAPPLQAPTWDEIKGASIPGLCMHPPTTLVDGKDVTLGEYDGYLELLQTLPSGSPGIITVSSNDAGPLTAVVVSCNAGGVGWPNSIAFFKPSGDFYGYHDLSTGLDWASEGMSGPGRDGVGYLNVDGSTLSVYTSATYPSDAECCPSTGAWVELVPRDGTVIPQVVYEDLGD